MAIGNATGGVAIFDYPPPRAYITAPQMDSIGSMDPDALTSAILVMAVMKRAQQTGLSAVLEKRGDTQRGAIVVRINRYADMTAQRPVKSRVETRQFDPTSNRYVWQPILGEAGEAWLTQEAADAIIQRQIHYDADCWVVTFDGYDAGGEAAINNPFAEIAGYRQT